METLKPVAADYLPYALAPRDLLAKTSRVCAKARLDAEREISESRTSFARHLKRLKISLKSQVEERTVSKVLLDFGNTLRAINHTYQNSVQAAVSDCVELALRVAREVIGREVTDAKATAARIKSELESLQLRSQTRIVLHSSLYDRVAYTLSKVFPDLSLMFESDESLAPGAVKIVTPAGTVDLAWSDHFDRIAQRVRSVRS